MAMLALKPGLDRCECIAAHAYQAPLPINAPFDEAGALEHLKMARNRGCADIKPRGDVTDRELAFRCEPLDDGAARGIRKRGKHGVE
jgi:hypothetical protein